MAIYSELSQNNDGDVPKLRKRLPEGTVFLPELAFQVHGP